MSASVPLGETALFTCAGEAVASYWNINGLAHTQQVNVDRGVAVTDNSMNSLYKSNLTIPGRVENGNVSIQCVLISGVVVDFSSVVYLTVLGKPCCIVD